MKYLQIFYLLLLTVCQTVGKRCLNYRVEVLKKKKLMLYYYSFALTSYNTLSSLNYPKHTPPCIIITPWRGVSGGNSEYSWQHPLYGTHTYTHTQFHNINIFSRINFSMKAPPKLIISSLKYKLKYIGLTS